MTDVCSAITAVIFAVLGFAIRRWSPNGENGFRITLVVNDMLKGASFFPFLLLIMSIWHNRYLQMLLEADRLVLFLSGAIAVLYVGGEFVRQAQGKIDNKDGLED